MTDKKTLIIDGSRLDLLQSCPYKLSLQEFEHLGSKTPSKALEKGDLMHVMLESYYKGIRDGHSSQTTFPEAINLGREIALDMHLEIEDSEEVMKSFRDYFMRYQGEDWVPIKVEEPFATQIYDSERLSIIYKGKIDLIVETKQGVYIVDHKTSSRTSEPSELTNQFSGYAYCLGMSNVIVNQIFFIGGPVEKRFRRPVLNFNQENLNEWLADTIYWCHLLMHFNEINHYPRNRTHCDGKFGACMFKEICSTTPDAREWKKSNLYVKVEPFDPFKPRIPVKG